MEQLSVDRWLLLEFRNAFQRAAIELVTIYRSESLDDVLKGIEDIDALIDEEQEEYGEDEYEELKHSTSELRF